MAWLETNHRTIKEQWIGFHKRSTGRPSITWPESVDAALCYGWIDGLRKSIDEDSYMIRFTPRKITSTWSNVNINRVKVLTEMGWMRPAGIAAFQRRKEENSGIYGYEQQQKPELLPADEKKFKSNKQAWEFFQKQAPWYRRTCLRWVMSAKREETRARRLATLIEDSENERTIRPLTRP